MLQELKAYRKNHGNTFVPQVHQGYPSLGNWVDTPRSEYVHHQKKKAIGEKWNGTKMLGECAMKRLYALSEQEGNQRELERQECVG